MNALPLELETTTLKAEDGDKRMKPTQLLSIAESDCVHSNQNASMSTAAHHKDLKIMTLSKDQLRNTLLWILFTFSLLLEYVNTVAKSRIKF